MKIAMGADHRGHKAATELVSVLRDAGHEVTVLGDCHGEPCDYPDQAFLVSQAVASEKADRGVLICGSGIGVAIAANKIKGIRAGVVLDEKTAVLSREHNDTNVLCLSADTTSCEVMKSIVRIWLSTDFEGGRHERRVKKIEAIERGEDPCRAKLEGSPAG